MLARLLSDPVVIGILFGIISLLVVYLILRTMNALLRRPLTNADLTLGMLTLSACLMGIRIPFSAPYAAIIIISFLLFCYCMFCLPFIQLALFPKRSLTSVFFLYSIPPLVIYGLFSYLIPLLNQNISAKYLADALALLNNAIGIGFLINIIFKYIDTIQSRFQPQPSAGVTLRLEQNGRTLVYELREVVGRAAPDADNPSLGGQTSTEVISMDYAPLTPEALRILSEAEQKIRAQTGSDVALVAYPAGQPQTHGQTGPQGI